MERKYIGDNNLKRFGATKSTRNVNSTCSIINPKSLLFLQTGFSCGNIRNRKIRAAEPE
jgi:hypothetical protein